MEALLAELESLVYGYNYQVFLRVYRVPFSPNVPAEWYITQALGPSAVVGRVSLTTAPEILAEVEQSLRYVGDVSCGPKPVVLRSRRFKTLVPAVLSELERAVRGASLLASFWLQDGHPAYPVFWEFEFVIAGPTGALVLIGSSSD